MHMTDLEFLDALKLVNYIRSEASKGNHKPDVSSKDNFAGDEFLKPVLQDDAVLFCLDELLESIQQSLTPMNGDTSREYMLHADTSKRVKELEEELQRLQRQFDDYRIAVGETLEKSWDERSAAPKTENEKPARDDDTHYFDSYSYNGTTHRP